MLKLFLHSIQTIWLLVYALSLTSKPAYAAKLNDDITNVLMILVDDLRPEVGAFLDTDDAYYPNMKTPNLDLLAEESIVFTNAYSNFPVCNPSRSSMLTGRRPNTTQVFTNRAYWRDLGGNFTTIPQYFKENGYVTYGSGKVFHGYDLDDDFSWTEPNYMPTTQDFWHRDNLTWGIAEPEDIESVPLPCMQIRDYAIDKIQAVANANESFFIAVGFEKPHLPFLAPLEFFEMYPEEEIYLPEHPHVPEGHPEIAWQFWGDFLLYSDIWQVYNVSYNQTMPDNKTLELRRAYYASVSYTDYLIGELLQQLSDSGLAESTAVLFISDHGFHLGEHSHWAKGSHFSLDTHIPMMLKLPGVTDNGGLVSDGLVELIDMFATLTEVVGLPRIDTCPEISSEVLLCHEGLSVVDLLPEPDREWKSAIFTEFYLPPAISYGIHTHEYNYIKWLDYLRLNRTGDWNNVLDEEMFDLVNDPMETVNIADDPDFADIKAELEDRLYLGWRGARPR